MIKESHIMADKILFRKYLTLKDKIGQGDKIWVGFSDHLSTSMEYFYKLFDRTMLTRI